MQNHLFARQPLLPLTLSLSLLVGCGSPGSSANDSDGENPFGSSGGSSVADPKGSGGTIGTGGTGPNNGSGGQSGGGTGGSPSEPNQAFIDLLSEDTFHSIFPITDPSSPYQEDFAICPSNCRDVVTYAGLTAAAAYFPDFAAVGSEEERRREIAAFFANVAKETTGGWEDAPGGKEAWGLCYCEEVGGSGYTDSNDPAYQAAPGQSYHGRGSIQMSYPFNYGPFSEFMFGDKNVLLSDPSRVATEALLFWASGIYFWMNEVVAPGYDKPNGDPTSGGLVGIYYKPSCHMAMTEAWIPRTSDVEKNRTFGFGVTINVINGGLECGGAWDIRGQNRVDFFDAFAQILGAPALPSGETEANYKTCQSQTGFNIP